MVRSIRIRLNCSYAPTSTSSKIRCSRLSAFATSAFLFAPLLALVLVSAFSRAQELGSSEYQWQTREDELEIRGLIGHSDILLRPTTGADRIETSGYTETLRAEYGVNRLISYYAQIGFANTVQRTYPMTGRYSPRAIGLLDPTFGMNIRHDFASSSLRYGMILNLAVEDQTIHANQDSNNGSGGVSLNPFLGFEWLSARGTWGTRVSYLTPVGSRSVVDERVSNVNEISLGGNTWTVGAFYEHFVYRGPVGAALSLMAADSTRTRAFKQTTNDGNGETLAELKIYAAQTLGESWTLLGTYQYAHDLAFNHALTRSGNRNLVSAGARWCF